MFIFDEPFVSDRLLSVVKKNDYPVLDNEFVRSLEGAEGLNLFFRQRDLSTGSRVNRLYIPTLKMLSAG